VTEPLGELNFHRLLVAVDGSPAADLALSAAITASRRSHAAVTLVAVAPTIRAWPGMATPVAQEDVDEGTDKLLRDAVARIPEDVPVKKVVRRGRAGPEIIAVAEAGDYDAILIGARGVGRVHGLIGSVSQYVLHHASITVLVAHPPPGDE
jgi:nucleotide-binding universal stress UspA family protein